MTPGFGSRARQKSVGATERDSLGGSSARRFAAAQIGEERGWATRVKLNFSPVYCKTEGGFCRRTAYA